MTPDTRSPGDKGCASTYCSRNGCGRGTQRRPVDPAFGVHEPDVRRAGLDGLVLGGCEGRIEDDVAHALGGRSVGIEVREWVEDLAAP